MGNILVWLAASRMRYWLAVIALLQGADAPLTAYLLTNYRVALYEASPLSAVTWNWAGLPGLLLLKCVGVIVIGLILRRCEPHFPLRWRAGFRVLLAGVSLFIVVNNLLWLVSASR